jgi:hypothetical protein
MYLAVFLKGYGTEALRKRMRGLLSQLERDHSQKIIEWDGMMTDNVFISQAERGLNALLSKGSR